jgi:hypothetical protein
MVRRPVSFQATVRPLSPDAPPRDIEESHVGVTLQTFGDPARVFMLKK